VFGGLVLGCVGVAALLRWPYLEQPLDRDSALYAAIGQRMGMDALPYRDFFDHKQPLVYAVYWLIDLVAPQKVGAIRLAAAVPAGLAAALVAWTLAPRIGRPRATIAAGLGLVLGAASLVQGGDLNTEHLLVFTASLSILPALLFQEARWRWLPFAVGCLVGLAALTKVVGAFSGVAALVPLLAGRRARQQSAVRTIALWVAGAAALPVITLLVFVAAGAGEDFLFGNIGYNRLYVAGVERTLLPADRDEIVLLTLAALALGVVRIAGSRGRDVLGWTFVVWLLGAAAGAQLSGRGFPHYYAPLIVPAAVLLALPLAPERFLRRRSASVAAIAAATVLATVVAVPFARTIVDDLRESPSGVAFKIYGPDSAVWNHAFAVADILEQHASPGDRMYVVGAEPEFYWASGLPAATRYLFDYPAIVMPERFRSEITPALCGRPPELLVLPGDSFPGYAEECISPARYRVIGRSGPVAVYTLNG